jgi:hypothetical protein
VLHEPQLQRCVPPCAVQAVLAFVTCLHSPEPLCRAALDLLMLLHTRLDLLAPPTDDIVTSTAGAITMPDGTRHPSIPSKTSGFIIHVIIPLCGSVAILIIQSLCVCPCCCSLGVLVGVYPGGLGYSCEGPTSRCPLPRPVPPHRGFTRQAEYVHRQYQLGGLHGADLALGVAGKRVGAAHISRFLAEVAIPLAKSTHTSQAAAAIPNNTGGYYTRSS